MVGMTQQDATSCPQSSGWGSLEHLLSSCPKALEDGHYCWHHYQVLRTVADSVATAIKTIMGHQKPKAITFQRASEKPKTQAQTKSKMLENSLQLSSSNNKDNPIPNASQADSHVYLTTSATSAKQPKIWTSLPPSLQALPLPWARPRIC